MALPKLNDSPKYEVKIPSTGKTVRFRPYLVKEEKVLMMAFESGDQVAALKAIVDTIQACVVDDLDVARLATFDIEYLFTQIRSKSVGESSTLMIKCSECEKRTEYSFDVSAVKVEMPKIDNLIELTPSVSIELEYPTYQTVMNSDLNGNELEVGFIMAANCIKTILTEEEAISTSDVSKEELMEFVESMSQEQFRKIAEFLQTMPTMEHIAKFDCDWCGESNEIVLKGMQDFLS